MVSATPPEELTLQQVADELGVHYMTAYRYVRIGMLPAHKEGRTWKVMRADLEAMGVETEAVSDEGDAPWAERLKRRLVAGDEAGSWKVLEAALAGGTSPRDVLLEIITTAMKRVGDLWEDGTVGVDQEHTASAICVRLVGRLGSRFARRGISKGTVVMGSTEHDLHGLPSAIASEVLRQEGFDVVDLGPIVPPADFARAAARAPQLVFVGVSATIQDQDDAIVATVDALRDAVDVPVFVGGASIRSREHATALGADDWASTAGELVEIAERAASASS